MASSNIKLFDENKGNMLNDTEFNISTQRLNGLQTGVASSQLQNKAMYQASLVAYAIAQIMLQNGLNANDTDAVSAFVANLSNTILQKVHDIATTEEAQAGTATGKWMSPALVKAAIDTLAAKAQNILSDATKASYGFTSDAVPDDVFKVLRNSLPPTGSVFWLASQTVPAGYLLCNGAAISRTEYDKLFAVIGTVFGEGDGSTTFNLPNLSAAFIRGAGTQDGYSATFGKIQQATSHPGGISGGWSNYDKRGTSGFSSLAGDQGGSTTLYWHFVRPYNIALTPIIKY